jgi:hypothetical protein
MLTEPRHRPRLEVVVSAVAAVVGIAMMLPSGAPAAAVALLLLAVPTYAAVWPFFAPRLGTAGTLAVGGALTVGTIVMAGFAVNLLPAGLSRTSWLWFIAAMTAVAAIIRFLAGSSFRPRRPAVAPHELVLVAMGLLLITSGYVISRVSAPYPIPAFTELSIQPSTGDGAAAVEVMVRSDEATPVEYRLEVRVDAELVASIEPIRLAPSASWRGTVETGVGLVDARLFLLGDDGRTYRRVNMRLPGPSDS